MARRSKFMRAVDLAFAAVVGFTVGVCAIPVVIVALPFCFAIEAVQERGIFKRLEDEE